MANVRDVMTGPPESVVPDTQVVEAAKMMRDQGIGLLLVTEGDRLVGVLSDRDLVVRGIAENVAPDEPVRGVMSGAIVSAAPDDDVESVVTVMRQYAVRRMPVVAGGKPVGVVSLGDLAVDRDRRSALADISTAAPNT